MRKRFINIIVALGFYGIIYFLNSKFFDIYQPYHLYTVSWTTRKVLPLATIVSIQAGLLGKRYLAFITLLGYIAGIVLGELFGGFESHLPPQYKHHGWWIWGCVYILSVIIGIIVEKSKQHKSVKEYK